MPELLGKERTLKLFEPIIRRIPPWFATGIDGFAGLPDETKSKLGTRMLAGWVQRMALAEAHADPEVNRLYVPCMQDQAECIVLEGEKDSPSVALLLNMARRNKGMLRTSRQRTSRHWDRRAGRVTLFGLEMIPVVCFWEPQRTLDYVLNPTAKRFGIGEEGPAGFYWTHTIPIGGEGVGGAQPDTPMIPNMPGPVVKLRRPDTQIAPARVGVTSEARERAEAERKRLQDQADNAG